MPNTGYKLHPKPSSLEALFFNGMKRHAGTVHTSGLGLTLNLGAGNSPLDCEGAIELDRPDWHAPRLRREAFEPGIEIVDASVGTIHAYHFFEHLFDREIRIMLEECDRVLMPDGVLNICVPYARSDLAFQDIDHKTFFTEETWRTLLDNFHYDTGMKRQLSLEVCVNVIMGVKGANLCVLTQMRKV
jgi:hypothetical protein